MYSTHKEEKSVVGQRFIRTLKNKIYKHMAAVSKKVNFDPLDDIVGDYHNIYRKFVKIKPIDVKPDFNAEHNVDSNERHPKFKVGNHVRIPKYKNIFAEGYTPNCSEEIFVIKKIKDTFPWTYVISDFNGEEIVGTFYKKELEKTNQKEFRIKKIIKRKGNKLYVKWKG